MHEGNPSMLSVENIKVYKLKIVILTYTYNI